MEKRIITEEDHLEIEWFKEAKLQTLNTLPSFMEHVINDYVHDYGTVCHAVSACALAAAWAANRSEGARGGITGFQAGFTLFDFIFQWQYPSNKTGLRIINYDDMLYPQYQYKFEKTIGKSTWESLQKEAKTRLEERGRLADRVKAHLESIVNGSVPFGYIVGDD